MCAGLNIYFTTQIKAAANHCNYSPGTYLSTRWYNTTRRRMLDPVYFARTLQHTVTVRVCNLNSLQKYPMFKMSFIKWAIITVRKWQLCMFESQKILKHSVCCFPFTKPKRKTIRTLSFLAWRPSHVRHYAFCVSDFSQFTQTCNKWVETWSFLIILITMFVNEVAWNS